MSQKPTATKRAALAERFDITNRAVLSNLIQVPLTKTLTKFPHQPKKTSGPAPSTLPDPKVDELAKLEAEMQSLVLEFRNLDQRIKKNDELQQERLHEQMSTIENQQLDWMLSSLGERNQIRSQLRHIHDQDILEGLLDVGDLRKLKSNLSESLEQDKTQAERISAENERMKHEIELLSLLEGQLDEEVLRLMEEENQLKIQTFESQRQLRFKQFSVSVIQEQYYSYKKAIRSCLFFCGKREYGTDYEPYAKVKNSKSVVIEIKDSDVQVLWSESKGKSKRMFQYRNNQYRFDQIYQRQMVNSQQMQEQFEKVVQSLDLFVKGTLYKQINTIHKNLSFNSIEYQMIYNQDLNEQIEKVRKMCDRETKEVQNNLIIYLSDKNRGYVSRLVHEICGLIQDFNNHIVSVEDIFIQVQSFQIKEGQAVDIIDGHSNNLEPLLKRLDELPLFDQAQFHIRIEILINNSYRKQLHLLALCPNLIDNSELFCKQFKTTFKKEKGFKEQLGPKVESIIKTVDKCYIIVETPEMVKQNAKQHKKMQRIRSIFDFYQQLIFKN